MDPYMRYDFSTLEKQIQADWKKKKIFQVLEDPQKLKRYILDMFPYPSGSGLHVGHLLGYFFSDALAILSRLQGYNVLHPMGFDAFGLPAEQYAIDTGQHPADTTAQNISHYKTTLQRAGLTFDWDRSFSTTDPTYYRWTQWIFLQLFDSWYDHEKNQAAPIARLIERLEKQGNHDLHVMGASPPLVTAAEWRGMPQEEQQKLLGHYRLAYRSITTVNWCPALGTVLANDEVKEGVSQRGGHPVVKKKMQQWSLRLLPYADRLLAGLDELTWFDSVKEMQRHWIGRSQGATITFEVEEKKSPPLRVFTTRPDTLFGVSYLALAPEHPWVEAHLSAYEKTQEDPALSEDVRNKLKQYVTEAIHRSERQRMQEVQTPQGVFTGQYALHPLTGKKIPIWVADYVLPQYGTGAVMAVPAHDARDYLFAKHFSLPILPVIQPPAGEERQQDNAYEGKEGKLIHSEFLNGLNPAKAQEAVIAELEKRNMGEATVTYKLRDPVFGRQRYWGEPFPIYYKKGEPYPLGEEALPLELPAVDQYTPTATGEAPLSRAKGWTTPQGDLLESHTMPAWAGSSWYFLRYMDPHNDKAFADPKALRYWQAVDYYIGGAEHTTGHLLYARFFTHFLADRGYLSFQEPFKRLINQGMLQGVSAFVYRIKGTNQFVSYGLRDKYDTVAMHVDVSLVKKKKLDLKAFQKWRPDLSKATFILEDGHYICGEEVEKMSKSKYNVVDPHQIIDKYGADALRLHLLFLGPITQSKPWNSQGIEGVVRFLKKIWHLFYEEGKGWQVREERGDEKAYRALHQAIQQITQDVERYALNTCISGLMILTNQLTQLQCHSRDILTDLLLLLAPFAPHMADTLWQQLGHEKSIFYATFPKADPQYLQVSEITYPVAVNGKTRAKLTVPLDLSQEELIQKALALPDIAKRLAGQKPKRTIVVKQRMVNLVL